MIKRFSGLRMIEPRPRRSIVGPIERKPEHSEPAAQVIRPVDRLAVQDGLRGRLWWALRRDRWAIVALVYAVILILTALVGPLLLGDLATNTDLNKRFLPPLSVDHGWEYVLGSDAVGRSFLARLVIATRTTLIIAVLAVASAAILGGLIGVMVGYLGGLTDSIAMRAADIMLAFPTLLLALVVLYTLPGGIATIIIVLAITRLAIFVRVARGETLAVRERLFIKAARSLGAGPRRIILHQLTPLVAPTIGVLCTLEFAHVILGESTLSFLGIGVQPPDVTWGMLIAEGQNYLAKAWWVALLPGLAITCTTICVHLLAEWFRTARETS